MNPLASLLITLASEVLLAAGVGIVAERLLPSVRDRRRLWRAILTLLALLTVVELAGLRTEARRVAAEWMRSESRRTEPRRFITEVATPIPSAEVDPSLFAAEMPAPVEPPAPSHWPTLLFALWLLGTVSILVRSVRTRWQLGKLVRHSERVDVAAAREIADRLGLAPRRVQLREAAGFGGPVAFGILRPTVLLPRGFANQHRDLELKVLLAHELAHLAARDPLWLAISDILTGLLWWHPAVWWARRRLRATSEAAADEASSLIPGGRIALAEALVAFGHQLTAEASPAGFGVGGLKSELAGRVTRLLSAPAHAASRLLTRVTLAGALGTILAIGIAPWPGEGAQPVLVAALESIESLEPKPATANGGATEVKPESAPSNSHMRLVRTVEPVQMLSPIATRGSIESIETNRLGDGKLVGYDAKALSNVAFLPAKRAPGDGSQLEHSNYISLRDEDAKRAVAKSPGMSRERIRARIDLIVLPEFVAEAGPLSKAVERLESQVRTITAERTGVNVLVNRSNDEPDAPKESDITLRRRVSLQSVSLRSALDALAAATTVPVAWAIEDYAVVFSRIPPESLRTRRYRLDPAQLVALVKPFQATGETNIQFAVREFFSTKGIEFPKLVKPPSGSNSVAPQNVSGSSPADPAKDTPAIFFNNRNGDLFVRAYQADLDRIERLLFQENQFQRPKSSPSSDPSTNDSSINSTTDNAAIRDRLQQAEANLKDLKTKYRERHPKVVEAVQALNALKAELERTTAPSKTVSPFTASAPADRGGFEYSVVYFPTPPASKTADPRQIEVEIKFAEVRESNVSGLGLDWIFGNSTNKASVIEPGSAQALEATPTIAQDNRYRVDLLRTIGERAELTPEQFKALLARLEAQAGTELLTAPKVLTSSGRQTKVTVTETKTLVDDVKAVSGSSTNKAAVQYQTRSVDLGPSVEFLPILEGDSLRMHLTAKVTEFLGYDDPKGQSVAAAQPGGKPLKGVVPLPHVRIRMAIADSTFPLGGTLALRGPLVTETVRMKDKVPVLGDVPLLGRLFRSESTSTYQKRLYVFVSPVEVDAAGRRK